MYKSGAGTLKDKWRELVFKLDLLYVVILPFYNL